MNAQNLHFFDKNGENLNFSYDVTLGHWSGTIYFDEISEYLYDNENLFILEKVSTTYKFPTIAPGESIEFEWLNVENEAVLFLYEVQRDLELNENFISKQDSIEIAYEDVNPSGSGALNISAPMQVNIAFSPQDEIRYERTLAVYHNTSSGRTKIAEIGFYGEGVEEDERFAVWAQNFGIKFLKEDANILKDYDIKEAIPDYKQLNQARKELLVSKEHIYPYIGTYRGLANFVNLLGYKDILQIKEYWSNINPRSSYFKKLRMVDITDYLDDGKIDAFDLTERDKNLKQGKQFKKTEFLALVYQFTKATDQFDDDGIPIVEETTEFTVNEIFYKLNRLGDKLKSEFLPINVKIKDVIGEFIYFQKLTISYWRDDTQIFDYDINEAASIDVYPSTVVHNIKLRALDPLIKRKSISGIDFGVARINESAPDPYTFQQKYTRSQNDALAGVIAEFYDEIKDQRIPDLSKRLSWEFGDDPERVIGAPVVLSLNLPKFTVWDLKGVKLEDLDAIAPGLSAYWTLDNIDYRNYYEIVWKITKDGETPYYFEQRGKIVDLHRISHILPYAGSYRVIIELIDFYGNTSVFSRVLRVQDDQKPHIVAFSRFEDKYDYRVGNLNNVQLQDFGASPIYYPKVNVLNNEDAAVKIDIYKNLIEWISFFKNRYGMGQNINDLEVYDQDSNTYVPFNDPTQDHPKKSYWGLGERDVPVTLNDLSGVEVGSLYWLRLTNLVHLDDFNAGFYIRNPKPGDVIKISLYSDYVIPNFSTLDELVQILNDSFHPAIRLFNYEIIDGKKSDNQYIIHAQAEYLSRIMYHILFYAGLGSPSPSPALSPSPSDGFGSGVVGDKYTFFLPRKVFSKSTVDFLKTISPVFDDETLFLHAKTSDLISGAVQNPLFWVDQKYWKFEGDEQIGYLPTTIDQNAFNINDIKLFDETFYVPQNGIVFFVINNIDGKNDFIWTLIDDITGEELFRAKSVPFFVWKFKDLGKYSIRVQVFDNKKTEYVNTMENFVRVLDKRRYDQETETRLNRRKLSLLKNRV